MVAVTMVMRVMEDSNHVCRSAYLKQVGKCNMRPGPGYFLIPAS